MDGAQPHADRPLVVLPAIRSMFRGIAWVFMKVGPLVGRGVAALARAMWRHRGVLTAIGVRALWVAALLLLVDAGQRLFQIEHALDPELLRTMFAVGLGLCAMTVLLAAQRRIRWAGVALGTVHGAFMLVLL